MPRPTSPWLIFATVALGTFMSTSSAGIVNTALPTISRVLGEDLSATKWVVASFLLTVSALLPTIGRLSDIYGATRIYNIGFFVFVVGSACIGLSSTLPAMIGFRILQAVGATALVSNNIAILSQAFPAQQRGKAIGLLVAIVGFGSMCGPALSGLILQWANWRWLFWMDIPLGLVGGTLALLVLPRRQGSQPTGQIAVGDAVNFAAIAICLILMLSQAPEWGWVDWRTLTLPVVAVSLGSWFIRQQRQASAPLLDITLFANPTLSLSALASFLSFVIAYFTLVLMPFYLDRVLNLNPGQIGVLLTYYPLTLALCSPVGGWLADRYGSIQPLMAGAACLGVGQLGIAFLPAAPSNQLIVLMLVMQGIGMGLFSAPNNTTIISSVPKERLGSGGSILAFMRVFGQVTGATLGVALLQLGAGGVQVNNPQQFMAGHRLVFTVGFVIAMVMVYLSFQLVQSPKRSPQ